MGPPAPPRTREATHRSMPRRRPDSVSTGSPMEEPRLPRRRRVRAVYLYSTALKGVSRRSMAHRNGLKSLRTAPRRACKGVYRSTRNALSRALPGGMLRGRSGHGAAVPGGGPRCCGIESFLLRALRSASPPRRRNPFSRVSRPRLAARVTRRRALRGGARIARLIAPARARAGRKAHLSPPLPDGRFSRRRPAGGGAAPRTPFAACRPMVSRLSRSQAPVSGPGQRGAAVRGRARVRPSAMTDSASRSANAAS